MNCIFKTSKLNNYSLLSRSNIHVYLGLVHDANAFLTATGIAILIGNTAASFGMNMFMGFFLLIYQVLKTGKKLNRFIVF